MKRRLLAFLLTLAMLIPMATTPVSAETKAAEAPAEAVSATDPQGNCPCGCGQQLKDVTWQVWDPATRGNPINGHYYLDKDYTHPTQYTVQSGVRMVLDLRGHKLTTANNRLFLVYGYAAVIDTIGGGRLSSNATGSANGGAVLIAWDAVAMNDEQDATFAMYNCTATLEKGKSGLNGGLFALANNCTLKIYNSTIINASAKERGGAIYSNATGATIEMYDSSIVGCKAPTSGGGIYSMARVTLKNCKLTGNETNGYGGNIYANQGSQTLENCILEGGISRSASSDGGGNFYAKNGCKVTMTGCTIRNGYAANHGGNVFLAKGTHTLTNTKISSGVCGKLGANLYCDNADAKTTLNGCQLTGDMYYGSGSLTLKGATKIGLNSNGLQLKSGTVANASGLTSGAEIYVDAEGVFTNAGTEKSYFKPALRTAITAGSTGLQATQNASGYCPHCKSAVTWTALNGTPSGHCYLTADISLTDAYSITTDTVVDLRGHSITSADRAFTVSADGSLTLLDSVGGGYVKGGGNADKQGGVIRSEGPLGIYGGNYVYTPNAAKPLTQGGILYATGAVAIYGGSFDGSAFNYTAEGCTGGTVYQAHNAGSFTMSAGYFKGGRAYSAGTMFIGGKTNTVTITGGILTGGYAAKNVGNLYLTGGSGTGGKATISGISILDGTTGSGDAGNFSLCYYGKSTMTDCFIARGTAAGRAGNAYFTTNTVMTLKNCILLAGTATQGGNFHTTATSTNVTLVDCLVTDGTATTSQGGNISCGNGTLTIRGGMIAYGTSATYGGNIANYTGKSATDDTLYFYADETGAAPILTGGHATTYGGNICTSGRLVLDAAVFGTGTANKKGQDLFLDKSDVSKLTVGSGVTGDVSIAVISAYLSSTYGGPVLNTAVTTLNAKFTLEVEGSPLLCASEGMLCVGAVTVVHSDGKEDWYSDTASAIRECPADGWIKLYADAELVLTKDCMVDLNGNHVTVSGNYTLYAMDTAGDDFSDNTGSAQWASPALVKTQTILNAPNGNTYIPVIDGATVSYHCIGMKLTHVSIRPETCGIYYRGAWGCDSTLSGRIAEYGIAVSLEGMPGEDFASDPDCLYTALSGDALVSGEQKASVMIDGIMKTALDAETNSQRGEMPVYAVAYVKLNDGTVLLSDRPGTQDDVAYSLYDAMATMNQQIETAPGTHRRPAVQAGRDFYAKWKNCGMQNWLFQKLQAPEDDGILKIIILGSSRSVNTFQLLYEAFKDQMPDQEFVMGVMYYSGCSMTMHENFIKTNQPVYSFYHNDNGRWVITPGKYMHEGLLAENWDVVLLQAGSGDLSKNMQLETRNFLKSYIDDHLIDPYALWWHSTWFNSTDPSLYQPPKTAADAAKVDQIKQLTQTNDAAKAYVLNDPMFAGHVTSGTPMMYALKVLDVPEVDLFRDHTHLSDFGCLLVAFSFYAQYTGQPVTQINLNTIPKHLRHKNYQHLGDMTVTEEMKQIIIDTVAYTMDNLWSVPTGE